MTNREIIATECGMLGIEYDDNIYSFAEWKKKGYSVKKGQKAIIKTGLWTICSAKEVLKNEDGTPAGEQKVNKFFMKTTALFHESQVEKLTK